MNIFKNKIEIPNGNKEQLDIIESFIVEWTSRFGPYANDIKKEYQVFLTKEDANKFKFRLIEAFKLIRHTSNIEVKLYENVEDCNDWEEIIEINKLEKDYEILSFKVKGEYGNKDVIIPLLSCGHYGTWDWKFGYKECLTRSGFSVYSVKRLSDEEIFTIGDHISCSITKKPFGIISKLWLLHDQLRCDISKMGLVLCCDSIIKTKQSLFTTEDGIDIYDILGYNVGVYQIKLENYELKSVTINNKDLDFNRLKAYFKYFSTKEAAINYIIENKPCLSYNDLKSILKMDQIKETVIKIGIREKLNL